MKDRDKNRLLELGQTLVLLGVEFRLAQIALHRVIDEHGMTSPEAIECSQLCGALSLYFSDSEEEFLQIENQSVKKED